MNELLNRIAEQTIKYPTNTVYQILIGKRTSTTLFFAFKNDLLPYFNILPQLDKETWFAAAENNPSKNRANTFQTGSFLDGFVTDVLPYRQGLVVAINHHHRHAAYKLLVQTLSYAAIGETDYIPLTNQLSIQYVIKDFFRTCQNQTGLTKAEMGVDVHRSLLEILDEFTDEENSLFLLNFEGAGLSAWTQKQIADHHHISPELIPVIIHTLFDRVHVINCQNDKKTNVLAAFAHHLECCFPPWNESVAETVSLMAKGMNAADISRSRNLKPSTIADHFVEISLSRPVLLLAAAQALFPTDIETLFKTKPPANYGEFQLLQADFADIPFWGFRYWEICYWHTVKNTL